jgi:preprotein translocase subunit YajC
VIATVLLMASPEGGGSPWATLIMFAAIFAIFYFLLIRPQKKQQEEHDEMVKALTKGDEVMTVGGILGEIIHVEGDVLTVKTAGDTRVEIRREKVGQKMNAEQED